MACWRHPAMTYGSHDPDTAPTTVEVWSGSNFDIEKGRRPIPARLLRQREQMNARAAGSVRPGHDGPCKACDV